MANLKEIIDGVGLHPRSKDYNDAEFVKMLSQKEPTPAQRKLLWIYQFGRAAGDGDTYFKIKALPADRIAYWAEEFLRAGPDGTRQEGSLEDLIRSTNRFVPLVAAARANSLGHPIVPIETLWDALKQAMCVSDGHGSWDDQATKAICPMNPHTGYPYSKCARFRRLDGLGAWMKYAESVVQTALPNRKLRGEVNETWCKANPFHPDCACMNRDIDPEFRREKELLTEKGINTHFSCWFQPCSVGIAAGVLSAGAKCPKTIYA